MAGSLEDPTSVVDVDDLVTRRPWSRCARPATTSRRRCSFRSSSSCFRMRNERPPIVTSASPAWAISSIAGRSRPATCAGSAGAFMVATATASGIRAAAASTAAPPRLWPTRSLGACLASRRKAAAATRSSTFDEKLLFANSPSLLPRPVKSKRSTAMPRSASVRLMRVAANPSLEHVKQ